MIDRMKELWSELDVDVTVNKRELVLGILACLFAGILLGVFVSPRKRVVIGSNNGNNNVTNAEPEQDIEG